MRTILSKKESEKKAKKKQLVGGIILIVIMFLSTIGYSILSNEKTSDKTQNESLNYKGYVFTKNYGAWDLSIGQLNFSFLYSPKEVPIFDSEINYLNSYQGKPLYILSSSSDAELEICRNLFYLNGIVERVQNACLEGEQCSGDYPVKTCQDNFIIIKTTNTSSIKQQDNCVFITGKQENLAKISDSFLLKTLDLQ